MNYIHTIFIIVVTILALIGLYVVVLGTFMHIQYRIAKKQSQDFIDSHPDIDTDGDTVDANYIAWANNLYGNRLHQMDRAENHMTHEDLDPRCDSHPSISDPD